MALADVSGLLPDPQTTPYVRWASLVVELLSEYNLSDPIAEDGWQSWAVQLLGLSDDTASDEVPDPYGFSNWRDWAARWIQILG